MVKIVALHVPLYKQHIYRTPMYASSLLRWIDELSSIGYHVPYHEEGLASYTHNVVLALVKHTRKMYREPKELAYWKTQPSLFTMWRQRGRIQQSTGIGPPSAFERLWG